MNASACDICGEAVTVVADRAHQVSYAHAQPPEDGHKAEVAPVTVTYTRDRGWVDVHCAEAGGDLGTVRDQETAHALAWTCLRRIQPPRNVVERFE